ncbi:hypothetical protein EXIGLDRAFT_768929 [Exidia glandulosa HHB12029]|uniref:TM7S3/TM198-like domain-containing protein n=1 Tax=Exidia glandulosa HHB12029 TaxID=1314781 RepID=A0A165HUP8_EXIGL|nr:hypothetical protein EXIGLDRAFT_768929 [Exidia glandulosa HHB12029]
MALKRLVRAFLPAAVLVAGTSGLPTETVTTSITTSYATTAIVTTVPIGLPTGTTPHTFTSTSMLTTTVTTTVPVTFAVSATVAAPTPTQTQVLLDTHLDPAFGVLGAILILTGLPTAFLGHKNRWSSFFIVGFYTLSLVTLSLILKFGVLDAINPPNKTLRGLFVLSCAIAGFVGGGVAVLIWKAARYMVGGWGGFALALWIQCFHTGGLIHPIGFRWLFYIACATVGFVTCTFPKWHFQVMLVSTAFVGATSFILGVDCYASSGLKEFYVFNLGFNKMFPKFNGTGVPFQLTQVMQILLGLIAAVFLMGAAVQFRVLAVLRKKLQEISDEEKRREEEVEARAAERFEVVGKDLDRWEKDHGRTRSNLSSLPLLMGHGHGEASTPDGRNSSQFSLPGMGGRHANERSQSPGALLALDLGDGIQNSIPKDFIAPDGTKRPMTAQEEADLAQREELLAEISTIRRSLDVLRSTNGTPSPSMGSEGRPRVQSFGQSLNELDTRFNGSSTMDRPRVQSMDMYTAGASTSTPSRHARTSSSPLVTHQRSPLSPNLDLGSSITRPTSTPMREDWDAYKRERTIVTPGSPPVESPAPRRTSLFAIPSAVTDALMRRQKRESTFLETGELDPSPPTDIEMGKVRRESYLGTGSHSHSSSLDNVPLARVPRPTHRQTGSSGNVLPPQLRPASPPQPSTTPVHILPPQRKSTAQSNAANPSPRTATFEELTARHREKLRTLQEPLTAAEKEQAQLENARERWERSRRIEKTVMERKEQDAVAKLGKGDKERGRKENHDAEPRTSSRQRHSRSQSADKLGGSKRMSTMKVEDWQRFQNQYDGQDTAAPATGTRSSKRDSRAVLQPPADVPFPGRPDKRRSRTGDFVLRDPPS